LCGIFCTIPGGRIVAKGELLQLLREVTLQQHEGVVLLEHISDFICIFARLKPMLLGGFTALGIQTGQRNNINISDKDT